MLNNPLLSWMLGVTTRKSSHRSTFTFSVAPISMVVPLIVQVREAVS